MARTDEHTKKFMEDVAGEPEDRHSGALEPLRTARFATKVLEDPRKAIGKFLVARATQKLLEEHPREFEKKADIDVLGLYGYMNEHHGREWWGWEPETLWKTIEDEHLSGGTPSELREALMALQLVLNTNYPFEYWHIFEKVGHAFNMNHVDFAVLQPLEPDEAALTMAILTRIRPKQDFDVEVLTYIAACAREAGMVYLPEDTFPGVQTHLDNLNFDMALRDAVKNIWENKADQKVHTPAEEIQLGRLREIRAYLGKGGGNG